MAAENYQHVTDEIANYVGQEYKPYRAAIKTAIENLAPPVNNEPTSPGDVTDTICMAKWNMEYKNYLTLNEKTEGYMKAAYSLVWGQ